jgi:hypothetical protein
MAQIIQFPVQRVMPGDAKHRFAVEVMQRIDAQMRSEGGPTGRDPVFHYIASHRIAVETGAAGDIELFGRAIMLAHATSRAGLIALSKYVALRFKEAETSGRLYLPEQINGQPWPRAFFRSLARQLRRMGREFPATKKRRPVRS